MSSHKRKLSDALASDATEVSQNGVPGPDPERPKQKARTDTYISQPLHLAYPPTSPPNGGHRVKPVPFQLPTQIDSFSYDTSHTQQFDDTALRYFVDPPPSARLDYGYDRWARKDDERGRLDPLLRALSRMKKDERKAPLVPDNGVVCWRGIMTKILTAPYEERDGWDLNVMFINGVLYLEEHLTKSRLQEKNNMTARQRLQTYYGYAFESYCTSETPSRSPTRPGEPPGWSGDVDTNVQWCSVVRTKLGDSRIIIGGEVDCVRGRYTGKTDTFVELKTSMAIRGPQDAARFEKKLLKFYFQSFLLGVPEIFVGFRTPGGVITTTQSFKTIEIPRLVRGKPGAWDPLICLDWGHSFLSFLKSAVPPCQAHAETRDSAQVWRATFAPGRGVTLRPLGPTDIADVVDGEDRIGFLPLPHWDELCVAAGVSTSPSAKAPPPPEVPRSGNQQHVSHSPAVAPVPGPPPNSGHPLAVAAPRTAPASDTGASTARDINSTSSSADAGRPTAETIAGWKV